MMIMMVYVLVDVPSTGRRCHRVLRELAFEPTYDLRHCSRLVLLSCRVLQLVLLGGSAALLRLDELRIVALGVVVVVGDGLMVRSLLVVVGDEVGDVAVGVASGDVLRAALVVHRRRRRHDHVAIQHVRIRRRVGLTGGMRRIVLRRRVVPGCRVSRLPEIRSRLHRRLEKRVMMDALANHLVMSRSHLAWLRGCLAVHVIVI